MATIYFSSRAGHPGCLILGRCITDKKDRKVNERPGRLQVPFVPICITRLQDIGLDFARQ